MKSFFRICVVISTVLVLGTSHPQNYHQKPGYYRDQRWNQDQSQNLPERQWPNYQQTPAQSLPPGPESANYQHFQKYPTQKINHAPAVVVNVNEVPQEVVHVDHTHRVRKISVPLSELEKYKGARIIHLKDTANPKDMKILRIIGNNETVYEEKDIPDSLKDIIAKALANKGKAIHNDPVNAQSVNDQDENVASKLVGSPRLRNRFGSGFNQRPGSGYPYRRRRPFQMNHNVPVQGIRRPAQVLDNDNVEVATVDTNGTTEKLDNVMPENTVAINDMVKFIASNEKPEVKSKPMNKQPNKVTEQDMDQQNLQKTSSNHSIQSSISDETKSDEILPTSDEVGSIIKESVSKETSDDDDSIESESEELSTSPNGDDDFSFVSKHGRTLLTTTDDSYSDIVPLTTMTESLIPINSNDDDDFFTSTELRRHRALLNNDDVSSKVSSTTATEQTTDAIDNNNVFIDNETSDTIANDNSNIISSISKTEPTAASTFTKPSEAPIKSLAKIVVSNSAIRPHQALDSSNSIEEIKRSRPYVIISPYEKEGNTTSESSLFTKLISYIIGKNKMNVAKIENKDKTEFEEATEDKYLENDEDESEIFKKDSKIRKVYRMTSKSDTKVDKPRSELKERENKVIDDETKTTNDSKENIVLTSDDAASTDEKDTLTPISFVTSLVRNALKGGDSLKKLLGEQRVKDFLLKLFKSQ